MNNRIYPCDEYRRLELEWHEAEECFENHKNDDRNTVRILRAIRNQLFQAFQEHAATCQVCHD